MLLSSVLFFEQTHRGLFYFLLAKTWIAFGLNAVNGMRYLIDVALVPCWLWAMTATEVVESTFLAVVLVEFASLTFPVEHLERFVYLRRCTIGVLH